MHPEQIGSLRSCVACRVRASALKYFLYEKVLQRKKTLGAAPAQFGSRWNGSLFAVLHTMPRRPEGWQDVHVAPLIDMGKPQRQRITHKNAQFI